MGFFSKAFKSKDSRDGIPRSKKKSSQINGAIPAPPPKPLWDDAWARKEVEPEEVQELLRGCTNELKSRGMVLITITGKTIRCLILRTALDIPFLLLPFRPASDPSAARTFIRNYFSMDKGTQLVGERLEQELILTEPMVSVHNSQS